MEHDPIQQYKERSISTKTPDELLLLLFDEMMKDLMRCGLAIDQQQYDLLETYADKSVAIINYLDDILDDQYPISQNMHKLYDYFGYQMARVKIGRNKQVLEEVHRMIGELRDSFRQAEKNCAEEAERKAAGARS